MTSEEAKIGILHDHYVDSFLRIREYIGLRDRLLFFILCFKRAQFGQHNPVDRRRWRHEIDFVILRPEGPKNLVEMRSFASLRMT